MEKPHALQVGQNLFLKWELPGRKPSRQVELSPLKRGPQHESVAHGGSGLKERESSEFDSSELDSSASYDSASTDVVVLPPSQH